MTKLNGPEMICLFTLAGFVPRTVDAAQADSLSLKGLARTDGAAFKITPKGEKLAAKLREKMVGDTGIEPVTPAV